MDTTFLLDLIQRATSRKFLVVVLYFYAVVQFGASVVETFGQWPAVVVYAFAAVLTALFVIVEGRSDEIDSATRAQIALDDITVEREKKK